MEDIKRIPEVIKKYPILAAGASFFYPGAGQILCGRVKRGIMLLFPVFAMRFTSYLVRTIQYVSYLMFGVQPSYPEQYFWLLLNNVIHIILLCVELAVRIWATYDAYQIASSTRPL